MKLATIGSLKRFALATPRQLASVKVGLVLILGMFAFMLIAAFYPSSQIVGFVRSVGQALALEDVSVGALSFQERFESPPFILLIVAVNLSICFSLYFRIRAELKRMRARRTRLAQISERRPRRGLLDAAIKTVQRELKRHGYEHEVACAAGASKVIGTRGGAGIWGSVLLHASILLICAAVVLSTFASFSASVHLTEGQAFDARVDRYGVLKMGPWYSPPSQPLTFRVVRVELQYRVGGATTTATIVEPIVEGKATRFFPPVPVHISNGLRHAGVTIHQGVNIGYAPQVVVQNTEGKRLIEGYVRLTTSTSSSDRKEVHRDLIEPRQGLRVELELFPDAAYRNGAYSSRSSEPRNPVLHVVVHEDGRVILDQFVPSMGTADGGGYTVHFGSLRRWSQIDVVDDPAPAVLIVATLLGSLGLALRLLCVRRRVTVSLRHVNQEIVFAVSGSTEKFQRTFEEELSVLRSALSQRLATPATVAPAGIRYERYSSVSVHIGTSS